MSNSTYSICANGLSVAICYHLTLILCRVCIRVVTKLRYFYFPSVLFSIQYGFSTQNQSFAFHRLTSVLGYITERYSIKNEIFILLCNHIAVASLYHYRYPISPTYFAVGAPGLNLRIRNPTQFILQGPYSRGIICLQHRP